MFSFLFGLILIIADIWALINIIQSKESGGKKILWILIILVFPIIGLIAWYFAGPKK